MKRFYFLAVLFSSLSFDLIAQTHLQPTETETLVKFTITDKKGIPEESAVVKAEAIDKAFSHKATTDIDGKCAMLITEGKPFKLSIDKFEVSFDFGVQNIAIKPGANISNYKLSIELVTTYKRTYTLDHMYFEPNQSKIESLKKESVSTLNNLYDTLVSNPKMKLEIAGHTDNSGEPTANLHLSQKRADAIREYLISKGIAADRILAKGYGHTQPLASNDYPEGRMFNRRTEIKIIEE
ncbi:MAG TPA: OmpA family protein [Cytophagaceae bacterium]|jgi:outer membrane protein OmpA-like peptidoglycan-associated protein|nr:OmpA family protein [Cytophagaceae bacterium]